MWEQEDLEVALVQLDSQGLQEAKELLASLVLKGQ